MNSPTFQLTVSLPHRLTIYGLVIGGHFPLTLLTGRTLLLDRNIVALLKWLARADRSDVDAHRYWLSHLNDHSIKINVGLCALEGRFGRATSFSEFFQEHDDVCAALSALVSQAEVLSYAPDIQKDIYAVQEALQDRYQAECAFLMETAPLIAERHRDNRLPEIARQVIETAGRFRLKGHSLVVLACLACLYEAKDGARPSSARRVLKPKKTYSAAQAHNAISDLRSLELLASTSAMGQAPVALCTADRGLAAFWCELGVRNPEWTSAHSFRFDFHPDHRLFPRVSAAEWSQLMKDLE